MSPIRCWMLTLLRCLLSLPLAASAASTTARLTLPADTISGARVEFCVHVTHDTGIEVRAVCRCRISSGAPPPMAPALPSWPCITRTLSSAPPPLPTAAIYNCSHQRVCRCSSRVISCKAATPPSPLTPCRCPSGAPIIASPSRNGRR